MKKQLIICFCTLMFYFTNVRAKDGTITGLITVKKGNLSIPCISMKINESNNRVRLTQKEDIQLQSSDYLHSNFPLRCVQTRHLQGEIIFSRTNHFKID